MKKPLIILLVGLLSLWLGRSLMVERGHSSYSSTPGVYVALDNRLSSGQLMALGWVNDVDGDGYPDILSQERPARTLQHRWKKFIGTAQNRASLVKLRSGISGEMIRLMHARGEGHEIYRRPLGVSPSTKRIPVLRRHPNDDNDVYDGENMLLDIPSGSDWRRGVTMHPQTGEIIRWEAIEGGFQLVGSQAGICQATMPTIGREPVMSWTLHRMGNRQKWLLVVAAPERPVYGRQATVYVYDWEQQKIIHHQTSIQDYDDPQISGLAYTVLPLADLDDIPEAICVKGRLGESYQWLPPKSGFQSSRTDAGRALFFSYIEGKPTTIGYWNLKGNRLIWSKDVSNSSEDSYWPSVTYSILSDYNNDGYSEIAIRGNLRRSDWLNLDLSESTLVACVLDGATGELFLPTP